jgi:hypothetical protein
VIAETIGTDAGSHPDRWGVVAGVAGQVASDLSDASQGLPEQPLTEKIPPLPGDLAYGWTLPADGPDDDDREP